MDIFLVMFTGFGVADFPVQQQPKWYPSRRNGFRQDHSNYCSCHVSDGEKEESWTILDYSPFVVSADFRRTT